MGFFGPSRQEVWQQLCAEIGADFVSGGFWKGSMVQSEHGPWTITLDTYESPSGTPQVPSTTTYTRLRAPFVNPRGFRFEIYRRGIFSGLGRLFGIQDVEIGYQPFDEDFIIKGNDERLLRELFDAIRLRELVEAQPQLYLSVIDKEGLFDTRFPENTDELIFQVAGDIRDVARLKLLFDLFYETLEQLCRIGVATDQQPGVELR